MRRCALSDALLAMLPGAVLLRRTEQDWHSVSFSGVRMIFDLAVPEDQRAQMMLFEAELGKQDFPLPGKFVADIIVTEQREVADGLRLRVEALLLADDV
jgi:hypothetical protein